MGRELAFAKVVVVRSRLPRVDGQRTVGGDRSAVKKKNADRTVERHGHVDPGIGRQRRGRINLLLAAGAAGGDGEAHDPGTAFRREEKVIRRVIAEIKNALATRATVPFHPGRKGAGVPHGQWEQKRNLTCHRG